MADSDQKTLQDDDLFPDRRCRLVLIGKTGAGKSATGNTILGRNGFEAQTGISSKTTQCGFDETVIDDVKVMVMDTPGLCDTEGRDKEILLDIARALYSVEPGPHALLLCLRCDRRFTKEEYKTFQALKEAFGEKMKDHLIVIFAGRDELGPAAADELKNELKKCKDLDSLLDESNRRYILFDNRTADEKDKKDQVLQLLDKVKEVVRQNGGTCFLHSESKGIIHSMYKMIKEELRVKTGKASEEAATERNVDKTQTATLQEKQPLQEKPESMNKQEKKEDAKREEEEKGNAEEKDAAEEDEEIPVVMREKKERQRDVELLRQLGPVKERRKRFTLAHDVQYTPESWSRNPPRRAVSEKKKTEDLEKDISQDPKSPAKSTDTVSDVDNHSDDEDDVSSVASSDATELSSSSSQISLSRPPEDDPEVKNLLEANKNLPGLTATEKRMKMEDDLRRKLATAPWEHLSSLQRKCLNKSATSAGKRLEDSMAKRKLKNLDQCRVM